MFNDRAHLDEYRARYCLPVIGESLASATSIVDSERHRYGAFEFWLDTIPGDPIANLDALAELDIESIVLWNRGAVDADRWSLDTRLEVLAHLSTQPCRGRRFIDLDDTLQQPEYDWLASHRGFAGALPLIASHHDYARTPSRDELAARVERLVERNPKVVKVSCRSTEPADALRLIELAADLAARGLQHVVIGMGPAGRPARFLGALWGARFIYAPRAVDQRSAPGQWTRDQLDRLFAEFVSGLPESRQG